MDAPARKPIPSQGWFDRLIDALAVIAGLLVCGIVVLICVDVFARNTGAFNMPWSLEVAQYSLLVITFFGAPWVLREQGHIIVDILMQSFSPETRRKVDRVGYFICAIVCAVLTYYAARVWWRSYSTGIMVHETFVFPEWIIMSVSPPIFLILMVIFIRWIVRPPLPAPAETEDGL